MWHSKIKFQTSNNNTMEMEKDIDIEKYVDQYFINHLQTQAPIKIQAESLKPLSRDDIDLLQMMNPNMRPQHYMQNLSLFYKKQENMRLRQERNQPMQLTLTTKCRMTSTDIDSSLTHAQQNKTDIQGHKQLIKLREECYLGLGKLLISRKQKSNRVELHKANYHTRQYLQPLAKTEVQRLQCEAEDQHKERFYIMSSASTKGILFEPDNIPNKMAKYIDRSQFRTVICTVNSIIQNIVYNHKKESLKLKHLNPLYTWLSIAIVLIISLLMVNSLKLHSLGLQMCCLVLSLCLMLLLLMSSCHDFHNTKPRLPLTQLINTGIRQYLNYLNSQPNSSLLWKTPSHLFWIQIAVQPQGGLNPLTLSKSK